MQRGGFDIRGSRGGPRRGGRGRGRGRGSSDDAPKITPVILAKPKPDTEGEEWPSIANSGSPAKTPASTSGGEAAPKPPPLRAEAVLRRAAPAEKEKAAAVEAMTGSCRLITDYLEWSEAASQFLDAENSDLTVISVVGPQGVGKSTLLSMLAGNEAYDMYRTYVFRPAAREATETGRHQTVGVDVYVTPSRVILLDTMAVLSPSVTEELIRQDKRYSFDYRTVENFTTVESVELAAWAAAVSTVVVAVSDVFPDVELLRLLLAAGMHVPAAGDPKGVPHLRRPHLVFAQQKTKPEEFLPGELEQRSRFLEKFMRGGQLDVEGGVSAFHGSVCGLAGSAVLEPSAAVSYFPFPELRLRSQVGKAGLGEGPDYTVVLNDFRQLVCGLPPVAFLPPGPVTVTEATWFAFARKMWEEIRKSRVVSEFGRLLT